MFAIPDDVQIAATKPEKARSRMKGGGPRAEEEIDTGVPLCQAVVGRPAGRNGMNGVALALDLGDLGGWCVD